MAPSLRDYLRAVFVVFIVFVVVYAGCDHVTSLRARRFRVDFDFEQRVPFVPELTVVYSSLYLMLFSMPFVLKTRTQLRAYVRRVVCLTILAGVGFLVFPAELAFRVPADNMPLPWSYRVADRINLTYNLCPSLHVAYAVFHAEILRLSCRRWGKGFHIWALAIAVAAWLTHQHHGVDLIFGGLLGFGVSRAGNPVGLNTGHQID